MIQNARKLNGLQLEKYQQVDQQEDGKILSNNLGITGRFVSEKGKEEEEYLQL